MRVRSLVIERGTPKILAFPSQAICSFFLGDLSLFIALCLPHLLANAGSPVGLLLGSTSPRCVLDPFLLGLAQEPWVLCHSLGRHSFCFSFHSHCQVRARAPLRPVPGSAVPWDSYQLLTPAPYSLNCTFTQFLQFKSHDMKWILICKKLCTSL